MPRPGDCDFGEPQIDLDKLRALEEPGRRQAHRRHRATGEGAQGALHPGRRATLTGPTARRAIDGGRRAACRFEHAILATGSQPAKIPSLALDSPRVMDSTSALDLPTCRNRCWSWAAATSASSSGPCMPRSAQGDRRRDDCRDCCRAPTGTSSPCSKKLVQAFREAVLLRTKVVDGRAARRHQGHLRERRPRAVGAGVREGARLGRPPAQLGDAGARARRRWKSTRRASSRPTRAAAPPSRRSTPSATSPASRCSRTRQPRGPRRRRGHPRRGRRRSIRPQFPPSSSPIPSSPGAGSPRTRRSSDGGKVEIAKFPWGASGRALTLDRTDGLTKLVVEPGTERVLGMGIVGTGAGELIAEGMLAIEMGAVASDVKLSIHAHPTLSETVMEAAEMFFGHGTHVYRPKCR